jgi:hypothetical protein
MTDAERRQLTLASCPDSELAGLVYQLHSAEQKVATLAAADRGPGSLEERAAAAVVEAIKKQVGVKTRGMVVACDIRAKALKAGYNSIDREISRFDFQALVTNAPALAAHNISLSEIGRIEAETMFTAYQAIYIALTNSPRDQLRSIIFAIINDTHPGEVRSAMMARDQSKADLKDDSLVTPLLQWHAAGQKLAMIQACNSDIKSPVVLEAKAGLASAENRLDSQIQDRLEQMRSNVDSTKLGVEYAVKEIERQRAAHPPGEHE